MDDRVTEFVRGLRASGVRVSVAEAADGLAAAQVMGVADRDAFRRALRAAMIKQQSDFRAFDALFPLYFGGDGPPLQNAMEDLDPNDQEMVQAALQALSGRLQRLMDWLTSGEGPSKEQLEALAKRMGADRAQNPGQAIWITRQMLRDMGYGELENLLAELRDQLAEAGMSPDAIDALMGVVQDNRDALAERIARQIGLDIAQRRAEEGPRIGGELSELPFEDMGPLDAERMRLEVRRLVALLRSRAALRQKRAKKGKPDPRRTLRRSMATAGVPMEIVRRRPKQKPRLVLIVDVSTSMRPVAEFMLRLVYELSDQVARARSFAFNADLQEITPALAGHDAAEAVAEVLYAIPPGYYATDLGRSLETFDRRFRGAIDGRTSLIVLGDGRNNYNAHRADLLQDLGRRSKRLIWLNPELPVQWGTGDSDMPAYARVCDEVHPVQNLRQLAAAVDHLLAGKA